MSEIFRVTVPLYYTPFKGFPRNGIPRSLKNSIGENILFYNLFSFTLVLLIVSVKMAHLPSY